MVKRTLGGVAALSVVTWLAAGEAWAQRAGDNAVAAAQDAFGTTVGNESIGLYTQTDVRGFNPTEAGNLRIDGLYFDRQGDTSNRIIRGSTMRVGLSAQSYPFPAPTGIVDFQLRTPGEKPVTSAVLTWGAYGAYQIEVDRQQALVADKLSITAGIAGARERPPNGTSNGNWNAGGVIRWRPNDKIEIQPFGYVNYRYDREGPHTLLFGGPWLPKPIQRGKYYGQDWADLSSIQNLFGFTARADLSPAWTLRAGVFQSTNYRIEQGENLFLNVQPDGRADRFVVMYPGNALESLSGEVRLSRVMVEGDRRHIMHVSLRARDKVRTFGGTTTIPLGPGYLGVTDPEPEPAWRVGPQSEAHVRQATGGVAYEGVWRGVGEIGFGISKTLYRRMTQQPGLPDITSRDQPWLFNGSAALYLGDKLVAYAGYTRSMEESADAPQNAVNRGEPVPAARTSQLDAGIRYAITPRLRAVVGVFDIKKPYFNLDVGNVYGQLGDVRHRGAEFSLSGQVAPGFTVVAGLVLIKARITGSAVTAGRIGAVPLGRWPHMMRLTTQYGPPSWKGFMLEGQIEHFASRYADFQNHVKTPAYNILTAGARYSFRVHKVAASLRLQAQNFTNTFAWLGNATGSFVPVEHRRYTMTLSADF